jgi:dienelactone hydrolase
MRAVRYRLRIAGVVLACLAAPFGAGGGLAVAQDSARQVDAGVAERPGEASAGKLATDLFETVERVAVELKLPNGATHTGDMVVTHFRPAGAGPFPVVVLSHGRSGAKRQEPARWRTVPIARYWTRRGFAVVVPTRVGYGELGQDVDPEASGVCSKANFRPAVDAMSAQIEAAVRFAGTLAWVDARRVVLSGVSYGGFGTIGATARAIPGVIGAINFAGGLGGNPERRPGDPCQGGVIGAIAAEAGTKSRVPMLWLYAQNDRYWGEDWPRRWHEAFTAAGGKATFATFPAVGEDGHKLMSQGFKLWRPVVDRFLTELGFAPPQVSSAVPASGFAELEDLEALPNVKPAVKTEGYAKFLAADLPRAFALSPTGAWAWRSGHDAVDVALKRCQMNSRSPCVLYAIDDRVVWQADRK